MPNAFFPPLLAFLVTLRVLRVPISMSVVISLRPHVAPSRIGRPVLPAPPHKLICTHPIKNIHPHRGSWIMVGILDNQPTHVSRMHFGCFIHFLVVSLDPLPSPTDYRLPTADYHYYGYGHEYGYEHEQQRPGYDVILLALDTSFHTPW